jgi:hypothetical protein
VADGLAVSVAPDRDGRPAEADRPADADRAGDASDDRGAEGAADAAHDLGALRLP